MIPPKPPRPPPPTETRDESGSYLAIFMAATVGIVAFGVLTFLTLGFLGPLALVVASVFAFVGLNYLIWGWWLKRILPRLDQDLEEHDTPLSDSIPDAVQDAEDAA